MVGSKTKTGVAVRLTGVEYLGNPTVRVELEHPQLGKMRFESTTFGKAPNDPSAEGIIGWSGRRVCVTVPRADFEAALAEARAIGEAEVAALTSGITPICLSYHDGEYLSGHTCYGRAALLLEGLGLAKPVEGWGWHVPAEVVAALGETFTYAQAAEHARPALEKARAAEEARRAERAARFAEACRGGRPVMLKSWVENCCERDFDCSLDVVTLLALPDGTTKEERFHTH